jgi:hypothetical protein
LPPMLELLQDNTAELILTLLRENWSLFGW